MTVDNFLSKYYAKSKEGKMAATKKKVLGIVLAAVLLFAVPAVFAACAEKEEKYAVAIKLANSLGQEWIFTPDIDELYYECDYTGEEVTYGVDAYYVYGAPRGGDRWLDCAGVAINYFGGSSPLFTSPTGEQYSTEIIMEKGEYVIPFFTRNKEWNYRRINLYVIVK